MRVLLMVALAGLGMGALGCGDGAREASPEVMERREMTYRVACASRHLVAEATENEQMLEATLANADSSSVEGQLTVRTSVLDFARAYGHHADLRAGVYAYLDSAVNHAATPADSARYAQRAGAFSTRRPTAGSIEENVIASYDRNIGAVLANEDHPCNWDLPF
ncbi:MAG TPA: hypothetical protein VMN39_04705 [Longimicrobiaceae bacterium]|nr:hypothetical protein [Longimicrobiaceae bacterium]